MTTLSQTLAPQPQPVVPPQDDRRLQVHDHGFVQLVGTTFDFADLTADGLLDTESLDLDAAIVRAARTSYQGGTTHHRPPARLIDYLMRHRHTSPFEQVELKFLIRAPLYVTQQFLRHRTANVNQESARYSVLETEAFYPTAFRAQDAQNKQASYGMLQPAANEEAEKAYTRGIETSFASYQRQLELGVSRELARGVLPHSTYTTFVWKVDLHNLLHFLKLRLDAHAQPEMQEYAAAIYALAYELAPLTFDAWDRHVRSALTFSSDELGVVSALLRHGVPKSFASEAEVVERALKESGLNDTRVDELRPKLAYLLSHTG